MADTHAVDHPRFQLRWLFDHEHPDGRKCTLGNHRGHGDVPQPLNDDTLVPRGNRVLYDRVKHGLSAALDAIDRNGTVLLPAYVPGGVTWAVRNAGFDVRYYPVNADLSLPVGAVAERIDELDPAAILFIHYFGFADEGFGELASLARERDVFLIEDCARGVFGRGHNGRLLGETGDLALFCLHKTLPVPNGGLVVARDAPVPRPTEQRSERGTIPRVAALSVARQAGITLNSTPTIEREPRADIESVTPGQPGRAPGGLTYRGLNHCRPEAVRAMRCDNYRTLRSLLVDDSGLQVVTPEAPDGASPYGVAALAADAESRQRLVRSLRSRRLPCEAFTWPAVYRHAEAQASVGAETLRDRLVVFPTHQELGGRAIERMAAVVAGERKP